MEEKTCLVSVKIVYGNAAIYPENATARLFTHIAGTKTLTQALLNDIRSLGFSIQVKQQTLEAA